MAKTLHLRQAKLLPRGLLASASASVVGLGTLGSWSALSLIKMGVPTIHLWDGDKVERHNAALQQYWPIESGVAKVNCMVDAATSHEVEAFGHRWWRGQHLDTRFIVNAVDKWNVRQQIAHVAFQREAEEVTTHIIDLRSGRETLLVYCVDLSKSYHREAYLDTFQGDPLPIDCRAQGMVHVGMRAGAETSALVAAILRGHTAPFMQLINLNLFDTEVTMHPTQIVDYDYTQLEERTSRTFGTAPA